jgi:hypothetical protein
MWTATYKLRPVTRCKEGCRRKPPGCPGGLSDPVRHGRLLKRATRCMV